MRLSSLRVLALGWCVLGGLACGGPAARKEGATAPPQLPPKLSPHPVENAETFLIHYVAKFDGMLATGGEFVRGVSRAEYKNCMDFMKNADDRNFGVEGDYPGHHVGLSIEDVRITGAGDYAPAASSGGAVTFDGSNERYNFSKTPRSGGTHITVYANGSGKLVFVGWENSSGEKENGSLSWECK